MIRKLNHLIGLLLTLSPVVSFAQAGMPDPTFSGDGISTFNFGGIDAIQSIALDEDGNIYAAGYGVVGAGPYKDIAVAKFKSDGTMDPVFGGDGAVTTDLGYAYDDLGFAIALQPDGKILVGGSTFDGEVIKMCVLRYRGDGSLDPLFGTGGMVIIDFDGTDDAVRSLAVLDDGSIIAGGYRMEEVTATMYKRNFAVVKLTSSGALDPSFGDGGKVATPFASDRHSTAFSMAVQADGKIVMAGYSYVGTSANYQIALARYLGNGDLDPSFDSDGMVLVSTGVALGMAYGMQLQMDNKIVLAGVIYDGFDTDFGLMRFNSDGTLDNSFGTGGITQTTYGTGEEEALYSLIINWDGRIVATGYMGNGSARRTVVLRYNADGSPDGLMGTGGIAVTDWSAEADGGNAVLIQPDGKILVGGYYDFGPNNDLAVMRYLSDPSTGIAATDSALFTIFPNPVTAVCQINAPAAGICQLTDLTGKTILEFQVAAGLNAIDLKQIADGCYTLHMQVGNNRISRQLIKN